MLWVWYLHTSIGLGRNSAQRRGRVSGWYVLLSMYLVLSWWRCRWNWGFEGVGILLSSLLLLL